jgi:DNA-binding response OmpR family regulator
MKKGPSILLAEDEEALGTIITESLGTRGFSVTHVLTGREALVELQSTKYDIAILDVMMPQLDGFSLVKKIRAEHQTLPVLFLTGKTMTAHVVEGFESGGNDYLKKPFAMEELVVRIKSLLNNIKPAISNEPEVVNIRSYTLNFNKQQLSIGTNTRQLTARETEVLKMLYETNQSVLEKKVVLNRIWGDDNFFTARTLDVFVTKLRKYFRDDPAIKIINVRGIGYKLVW